MMRFVHAADLHLDSPFRGLGEVPERQGPPFSTATFDALTRIVALALQERVDAVFLAGDLYERKDQSLRARLHLARELGRLDAAGIRTFLVHGNHDPLSATLSPLALPPSVTVFGASHEEVLVPGRYRVQGVSFVEAATSENLARRFARRGPELTIGVLHCNLGGDASHADYAPCTREDLEAADLDYWALGHVHTRAVHQLRRGLAAYPGNSQGRHVNEPNARGCLLVELDEARERPPQVQFVPCDAVRWHRVDLDIGALESVDELAAKAIAALAAAAAEAQGVEGHAFRLRLHGRGRLHRELVGPQAALDLEAVLRERCRERPWLLEKVHVDTRANLDLGRLVASGGLSGELARLVAEGVASAEREALLRTPELEALSAALARARLEPLDAAQLVEEAARLALELVAAEEEA